jgi:iron complex outermembrane receptor protein
MLLASAITIAQECRYVFKGQVVDFHDKSPLAKASIFINQIGRSAVTDAEGNFLFKGMCPGTYQIQAAHSECQTLFLEVEIAGDTYEEILLEHHRVELEEVRVFGAPLADKTISAIEQSLEEENLEQFSGASLGDALKTISGVSSLNTGANIVKPAIHGLNGSRVLILNDGVRMQDMEWGDEHAPNIDINAANSVTVIKGASALKYGGDAIGGVIVLEQNNLAVKDTLFGKTLLTGLTNGRGGTITSELNKSYDNGVYLKGQASYKRLGDAEAPDYILSNTGIREVGASFQLGRKQLVWGWDVRYAFYNAEIAILRASHIGNVDDLIRSINSGEPEIIRDFTYDLQNPRQEVTHHLAKAKIYRRFEGLGRLNIQYDFQNNRRFEYDVRRGEADDRASIDLELQTHTLTTDFKLDANEDYELQFGLLGRFQDNFANPATGVRRLIPDYERYDLGSFITGEYFLSELWTLEAGLRYDYNRIDAQKFYRVSRWEERGYDQDFADIIVEDLGTQYLTNPVFNYHNFSASAGIAYKDENQNFRFNYALSQRAPNPSELFSGGLHHSAARIELGDLRIDQETSHKFSFSFEKGFDYWGFTIEPYANFIQDFVLLEPTGVEFTLRGAFPVWSFRQTDARLLGVDVAAYVDYTQNWRSDHRFSLVKGNDTDTDIPLINIPAANIVNQIAYTQPEWHNLQISLESQYVFRQNETPDDIIVFSPEQQQNVLLEINTAPEAYHLLNLNSRLSFPLGGRTQLTTALSVNNLLDTSFRDYLNRQRFFADDLGRNIILQLKLNY